MAHTAARENLPASEIQVLSSSEVGDEGSSPKSEFSFPLSLVGSLISAFFSWSATFVMVSSGSA